MWRKNLRQTETGSARRDLENAERQAIEARRDYWLARTNLARAVGGVGLRPNSAG